jgi:NAD(P)-dependent dehydrogenase (short-subunit alcohol dehydrogenase family)
MSFQFKNVQPVLVIGASSEIGSAWINEISRRSPKAHFYVTSRNSDQLTPTPPAERMTVFSLDPACENSWKIFIEELQAKTNHFDAVLFCPGVLHGENMQPERSVKDIDPTSLMRSFEVNALSAALAVKHLIGFFSKEKSSVFAFLSAKLGSIEDNRNGGWMSYRASKAALNMIVKTAAIEYERKRLRTSLIALHPGTTKTKFSRPFLRGFSLQVWSAEETAIHLCDTLEKSASQGSGLFRNWDGAPLPW